MARELFDQLAALVTEARHTKSAKLDRMSTSQILRVINEEDRRYLVDQIYNAWSSALWTDPYLVIDNTYLTEELNQWVIEKVLDEM